MHYKLTYKVNPPCCHNGAAINISHGSLPALRRPRTLRSILWHVLLAGQGCLFYGMPAKLLNKHTFNYFAFASQYMHLYERPSDPSLRRNT